MNCLYSNVIEAKDGTLIPVFTSGKTMYSKYSPCKETETFANNCKQEQLQFFLICGIGNGLHIISLRNKFPKAKILAFETYQDDLDFLEKHFKISDLSKKFSFDICLQKDVAEKIITSYIPIIHGDFSMLQHRAWTDNNKENVEEATKIVKKALDEIAADISTQSYFGKIWHRNIIQNLLLAPDIIKTSINTTKKEAFIVAAGPSLDSAIKKLKIEPYKKNQFIISTDTALPILIQNKIQPDIVVTIDGQIASRLHFFEGLSDKTCIVADLACSPIIIRKAIKQKCPVFFTESNHPLTSIISDYFYKEYGYKLPKIYSGAGTVTIAALDIAIYMGFKKINIAGADFAYIEGQSYARGSYFEKNLCTKSSRLNTYEQDYITTFFNKKLIDTPEGLKTTVNLNMYRESFEQYINTNQLSKITEEKEYAIKSYKVNQMKKNEINTFCPQKKECTNFLNWYITLLQQKKSKIIPSVLPLATWEKKNNKESDIFSSLKLAYYLTVRYNNIHGK